MNTHRFASLLMALWAILALPALSGPGAGPVSPQLCQDLLLKQITGSAALQIAPEALAPKRFRQPVLHPAEALPQTLEMHPHQHLLHR